MVNTLIPGSVKKVNTSAMAFKCMENINNFLAVAVSIGVPSQETFQSVDLWERQNLNSVVICLQSLGRKVMFKKILFIIQCSGNNLLFVVRLVNLVLRVLALKKQKRTSVISVKINLKLVKPLSAYNMDLTREQTKVVLTLETLDICKDFSISYTFHAQNVYTKLKPTNLPNFQILYETRIYIPT